ncbi:hypothetical protein [Haloprofundus salinisoli]|uniref:hypothetical protein n=1 Tax=Haloprofundus salinisoli TaxID=2876193 RepID=UPI001CCE1332|nr:hypothetical protein [Haloprofundus salinisoli]
MPMEKSDVYEVANRVSLTVGASAASMIGVVSTSTDPVWFVLTPIAVPAAFLFGDFRARKKRQKTEQEDDSEAAKLGTEVANA